MAQQLSPTELAAVNNVRIKTEETRQSLLGRVIEAQKDYTGTAALSIRISPEEAEVVNCLSTDLPAWSFYASAGGKLYFGTEQQIQVVRDSDPLVCRPPRSVPPDLKPAIATTDRKPTADTSPLQPAIVTSDIKLDQGTSPLQPAIATTDIKPDPLPVVATPSLPLVDVAAVRPLVLPDIHAPRRFTVCDVEAETLPFKTMGAADVFQRLLGYKVEACNAGTNPLVQANGFHALVETAHLAFAGHYGLELSPDHVWVTIAQGFARVVNHEPEKYRGKFVLHQGKQVIEIHRADFTMGSPDNNWPSCFGQFGQAIAAAIGADNHGLVVSDFSTTGPLELAVSNVVLMDTVQSYFTYRVGSLCGIPFVTLRGTPADWRRIVAKARGLHSFGALDWWLGDLLPILEKIAESAEGKVDRNFWNSIYKAKSESGGIKLTGWLPKLLPLMKGRDDEMYVNPLLGKPLTAPHKPNPSSERYYGNTFDDDYVDIGRGDPCGSVNTSSLPASLSTVPFTWKYLDTEYQYKLAAGIVGTVQNESDGSLRPQLGWAVLPDTNEAPSFKGKR